ncbi:hypothetical protein PIB30_099027 [Stylosanthes scabra]|uniref:Uncharacterized protein n=1 Tax=Stylosanthes scabra TaxID=79078 RepID=A0ABU6QXG5_9FABA|nr:hypothetical protein [Stylosanthes scabra]
MSEERWFDDANKKLAYDERLSKMEILPPRFIGDGVLPDEKYPEFWRLIDIQGLRPFLYMRERISCVLRLPAFCFNLVLSFLFLVRFLPVVDRTLLVHSRIALFGLQLLNLFGWIVVAHFGFVPTWLSRYYRHFVGAAYTTMFIQDNLNDDGTGGFAFGFRLGGRTYEFLLSDLATVWGLKNEGVTFKGGNNPHGTWNEFNKMDAIRGLWLEHAASGKYAISRMSTDHRLLLYVLSYVLLPRKSNHGSASEEDLLILSAMPTSFLAHAHLLTKVFEIAPLDLTREDNVELETSHAITSKNIHQMQRNLVGPADIAEDVGVDVVVDAQPQVETGTSAQIPTETGVPPQFQPDIAEIAPKGFEDLRLAITEGFTRFSDRIDQIDTHLISQDTDLRNLQDEFHSFHGERMYVDFQEQPEDNPMQD